MTRAIHDTHTQQHGLPVVRVDKLGLFTWRDVGSGKSGFCLDGFHGDRCRWAPCSCDCHEGAL